MSTTIKLGTDGFPSTMTAHQETGRVLE